MNEMAFEPTRHKLDVAAYHRMGEAGILAAGERIELIDGELIDMAPIGQGHAAAVTGLAEALFVACAGRAIVSPQHPLWIDPATELQPDLAVLRRRDDFYATGERPGPGDVLLVVEVADSSLRFDETVKLSLYARAGIGEFWIVDLKRRAVDVYRGPQGDGYRTRTTCRAGEQVALVLAPEIVVTLSVVFG